MLDESDGTYQIVYAYDYDGTIIRFYYDANSGDSVSGADYFYLRNQQGYITTIIDNGGNTVVKYRYDAYGNILGLVDNSTGDIISKMNPYTYRGYRYDSEIGYYYLNSRYYNPEIGRFISSDKVIGQYRNISSSNMYVYASNNPVNLGDEEGEFWHLLGGFVVGAAIGATSRIISNLITGSEWSSGVLTAAAVGGISGLMTAAGVGSISIGLLSGIETGLGNQIETHGFEFAKWNVAEIIIDIVVAGVLSGWGSAYGSNKIGATAKQIKNWFNPQSFKSLIAGNYMKKITTATAYSCVPGLDYAVASALTSDSAQSSIIEIE